MKITILGCGNAFSTINGNNCILVEDGYTHNDTSRKLLIDAGWDLPNMLKEAKVDVKSITDVYLSHQHADHIGGMEYLGFSRYDFVNKPSKAKPEFPTLIANSALMKKAWDESLKGGMSCIEGVDCELGTFFNLQPIEPNQHFDWCGWDCRLVQQVHIMSGSVIMNTFGIIMKKEGHKTVYFVTDSQHCSPRQAEVFYKEADIIFQDCEIMGVNTKTRTMNFCSGVHANYGQLAAYANANSTILPAEIKKKMWLTHYQDFLMDSNDFYGNIISWDTLAKADGFQGFVYKGQTFEV